MSVTGPQALKGFATLLGALWVIEGVRSFLTPEATQLSDFGTPSAGAAPPLPPARNNPWIPMTHARTGTVGAIVLHLAYQRKWNAIGVVYTYGVITGLADAYYAYLYSGTVNRGLAHLVPTAILGVTGLLLQRLR